MPASSRDALETSGGQLLCPGHDSEQPAGGQIRTHHTKDKDCNNSWSSMKERGVVGSPQPMSQQQQQQQQQQHSFAPAMHGPLQQASVDHTQNNSYFSPQKPAADMRQQPLVGLGSRIAQVQSLPVVGVPVYYNGVLLRALGPEQPHEGVPVSVQPDLAPEQPYDGVPVPAQPILAPATSAQRASTAQHAPEQPHEGISVPRQPVMAPATSAQPASTTQHDPEQLDAKQDTPGSADFDSGHLSGPGKSQQTLGQVEMQGSSITGPACAAAVDEAQYQEALDALLALRQAVSSSRVRRAPKRLADEDEGPQWGTPENPLSGQRRRGKRRLKMCRMKELVADTGPAVVCA